jgi:hypothetical protein
MDYVLILSDVPLGRRVKLARVAKDLRLADVAYLATEWCKAHDWTLIRVQGADVSWLERGGVLRDPKRMAILAVLGVQDGE